MRRFIRRFSAMVAGLSVVGAVGVAHANDEKPFDEDIRVERAGRVTVEVRGVACSFCAYGTEKNLARLKFVNSAEEEFGGDGVLLDVKHSRVMLAVDPKQNLSFDTMAQAITKGGYTFVAAHVRLVGRLVHEVDGVYLQNDSNSQRFALRTIEGEPWNDDALIGQEVVVQAAAPASDVTIKRTKEASRADSENAENERPIRVRVKAIERGESNAL